MVSGVEGDGGEQIMGLGGEMVGLVSCPVRGDDGIPDTPFPSAH